MKNPCCCVITCWNWIKVFGRKLILDGREGKYEKRWRRLKKSILHVDLLYFAVTWGSRFSLSTPSLHSGCVLRFVEYLTHGKRVRSKSSPFQEKETIHSSRVLTVFEAFQIRKKCSIIPCQLPISHSNYFEDFVFWIPPPRLPDLCSHWMGGGAIPN